MRARVDAARVDIVLGAVLFVGVELQVFLGGAIDGKRWIAALVAGIVTASVAARRRYPVAVGFTAQGLLALFTEFGHLPAGPLTVGWFCALYALAVWSGLTWFLIGLVFVAVTNLLPQLADSSSGSSVGSFTVGVVVAMVLLRSIVGERERRLRIAERERDVATREAILDERGRIARELHDTIAHHVSMMVIQAGAERRCLDATGRRTAEVLMTIEQIGRGALTEMRRLVGMLRSDQGDALVPQPGIADVPTLVAQLRDAGMRVELQVDGEPRELPVGIELSAYRVIQEGLTNTLKHAGQASAAVHIRYTASSLELEIVDNGSGATPAVAGSGLGLVGIRERVALYGGQLDAGQRAGGGFVLRVLLPTR